MVYHRLISPKALILTPLILLLTLVFACGGTAAEPIVVEKEVIKEVPKEVIVEKEVVKEVPKEVIVEKEVIKEVQKDIIVFATPVAAPKADASNRPEWVDIGASKHYNGDFPFVATSNPGFWDVHYGGSLNTVLIPSSPRFSGLLEYDPVNPTEVIGDLAKTWEWDNASTSYIFHLNDAKWSNGTPVTADDVVFSLDRITIPGALRARTGWLKGFYEHKTATAIDEKTVRVPLKFPAGAFIPNLASDYNKIYPKALENLSQEDFNCCPEKSYGSGPWVFRNWKKDASFSYDRNQNYFKAPRPFFDGMQVYVIKDYSRIITALTAGQAYGTYQPISGGNRPPDMVKIEEDTKGVMRAVELSGASIQGIWLNTGKPPFDNPKVRKAFYIGLDRQAGVDRAVNGFGAPGTFFAPGVVENIADLKKTHIAYKADRTEAIAQAKKLFVEAGYPNGFSVTINSVNTAPSLPAAEVMAAQMRQDFGIEVTIVPADLATMYVHMRDGDSNMDTVGTGLILRDPGDILNQFYDKEVLRNTHNWGTARTSELFSLQAREPDHKKRIALISEFAKELTEGETPHYIPYFWYTSGGALDYRIRNYHTPPTVQLVHKWDQIWFDPDRPMPKEKGYVP